MKKLSVKYAIGGILLITFLSLLFAASQPQINTALPVLVSDRVSDVAYADSYTSGSQQTTSISSPNDYYIWSTMYWDRTYGASTKSEYASVSLSSNMQYAIANDTIKIVVRMKISNASSYDNWFNCYKNGTNTTQLCKAGGGSEKTYYSNGQDSCTTTSPGTAISLATDVTSLYFRIYTKSSYLNAAEIKDMYCTLSSTDSTAPTVNTKGNGSTIYTTSSTITLQDGASGIQSYSYSGTASGSYSYTNNSVNTGTGAKTFSLPQFGKYTITVTDNVGNANTSTVYYYNPTIEIISSAGGSSYLSTSSSATSGSSSIIPGLASTGASNNFYLYSTPDTGYYFSGWTCDSIYCSSASISGNVSGTTVNSVACYVQTVSTSLVFTSTITFTANFAAITLNSTSFTYTGSAQGPTVSNPSSGYSFEYTYYNSAGTSTISQPTNIGSYKVLATIKNGSVVLGQTPQTAFVINQKSLSGNVSFASISAVTYRGSAYTPTPTVTDTARNAALSSSSDFTYSYSNNTNVGTATITATGKGNYTGSASTTFTINLKSLSGNVSFVSVDSVTYNTSAYTPTPTVTDTARGVALSSTSDFTYSYSNNTNAGTATITATGKGNYTGSASTTFIIQKMTVVLNWQMTSFTYNKISHIPTATVTNLFQGDNCTVTVGGEQTNAGSYTATATALSNSNYALPSIHTIGFIINPFILEFSWADISFTYDGNNHLPVATATNLFNGDTCVISVTETKSSAGQYTATASTVSNNNYILPAAVTTTWNIISKVLPASYWTSTVVSSVTFNGSRFLPIPVVTDNLLGTLVKDRDYSVVYGVNYATSGTVTVTGIGNYQSETVKTFTINKAAQSIAFLSAKYLNDNVRLETIATELADYEITFLPTLGYQGNYITVYAYTTAIFPDAFAAQGESNTSQMAARKTLINVASPGASLKVDYVACNIVEIGGVLYSCTTAKVYLSNVTTDNGAVQYGINTLSAAPEANAAYNHTPISTMNKPVEDGYTAWFGGLDTTPLVQTLFIKRNHIVNTLSDFYTVSGDPVILYKTYGDIDFQLSARLNSGKTDFTLTSDHPELLSILGAVGDLSRTAIILNAGIVTVTLHHPGFVPGTSTVDLANSYAAMDATLTVIINQANLKITFISQSIVYGEDFVYDKDSFKFEGFVPGDDSSLIEYITFNDLSAIKNTGTYNLTVSEAGYVVGAPQNYYFTYPSNGGVLTITKKDLEASFDLGGAEMLYKIYGQANPGTDKYTITYDGFVAGETEGNALAFVAPSVDFGGVTALTNIGDYTVCLTGGSARNYNIDIVKAITKLRISKATLNISLLNKTVDYNGLSCSANTPVLTGVAGGTIPAGICGIQYFFGGAEINEPINVGEYTVRIVYTALDDENYESATSEFGDKFEILPIAPTFPIISDYNAQAYSIVPINNYSVIKSIPNGSDPVGLLSYTYYRYSTISGEYTETIPKDSGTYSVKVKYLINPDAVSIDNYDHESFYYFEDVLIIEKIHVSIELSQISADYKSTDGISPATLTANAAVPHGVASEYTLDNVNYPYNILYRYLVNGAWQTDAPYNAGSYTVEVTFVPDGDILNYKETLKEIEYAVVINAIAPQDILLAAKSTSYTGKRVSPNAASAVGITGGSVPEGNYEYQFAPHDSEIFSKDIVVVNVNPDGGGYDVLVKFYANPGSNYVSYNKIIKSAIIIDPVSPSISLKATAASFTGAVYDINKLSAYASGISGGCTPLGSLSYEFMVYGQWITTPPMDVGFYSVRVTFTPAASGNGTQANYTAAKISFTDILEIKKVNPSITISYYQVDFTGESIAMPLENIHKTGVSDAYIPAGTIKIQYSLDDLVWSDDAPSASDTYNIKIIYTPGLNENYNALVRIFMGAFQIENIPPIFADLQNESYVYNGLRPTVGFTPMIEGLEGNGTLSLQYEINNSWSSRVPSDVGTYNVRISYSAKSDDNYKSFTKVYTSALTITPCPITIIPVAGKGKVYDTLPAGDISYIVEGLLSSDRLIGSLSLVKATEIGGEAVTLAATDVGIYTITLGDLRLDTSSKPSGYENNFTVDFISGVDYHITPAEVELSFTTLSASTLTYRSGDKKSDHIDVTAKCGNISVAVSHILSGNDTDVGKFRITALLDNDNYSLPEKNWQEYTILPATFSNTDFNFESAVYTYNGSEFSIAANFFINGSSVVYSPHDGESLDMPAKFTSAGVYQLIATITHANYDPINLDATLTIAKATPAVKVTPLQSSYYYKDTLPAITCDNQDGYISLDADQILLPTVSGYRWTFIPNDTNNYYTVHGVIPITVIKMQTSIQVSGQTKQSTADPQVLTAVLESQSGIITALAEGSMIISYTDKDGNIYAELPVEAGKYIMTVTYNGDSNYSACSYSTVITVTEPTSNKWLYILIAVVGGIALLAIIAGSARRRRA